jgi:hypothetical protein
VLLLAPLSLPVSTGINGPGPMGHGSLDFFLRQYPPAAMASSQHVLNRGSALGSSKRAHARSSRGRCCAQRFCSLCCYGWLWTS